MPASRFWAMYECIPALEANDALMQRIAFHGDEEAHKALMRAAKIRVPDDSEKLIPGAMPWVKPLENADAIRRELEEKRKGTDKSSHGPP